MKSLSTYCPQRLVVITCKCAIYSMVQLTFQVPRPPKSHDSNDLIKVERSQSMKSFRDILSSTSGGDYLPVYNKLNCTTHLSSAKTTRCHCYFTAISVVIILLAYLSGTISANLCNSRSFSLGIVTILLLPHTL